MRHSRCETFQPIAYTIAYFVVFQTLEKDVYIHELFVRKLGSSCFYMLLLRVFYIYHLLLLSLYESFGLKKSFGKEDQ